MKNKLLILLMLLGIATPPLRAQFIGYTSPQTVQQTLGNPATCTGSAQTFVVANLGQQQHYASVASILGAQKFQAEIDGIDRAGNVIRISDQLELAGVTTTRQGALYGSGYFPQVQLLVTCSPNTATFVLSYAGGSASTPAINGAYLTSQIDHVNFVGAPGNANQQDNFQTPFGNAQGTLYFQFITSSSSGATLSVACNTNAIGAATTPLLVTLANSTALQTFTVPPYTCPLAQVTYGNTGAVGTVTAEYVFSVPGYAQSGNGQTVGSGGTDPCFQVVRQSQPVNIASATTTQIIPVGSLSRIFVCGFSFTEAGTTPSFQFEYGTGLNCATGTTVLTGVFLPVVSSPFNSPGGGTQFSTTTGQALCIVTAGTGPSLQGYVSYVQQ